MSALLLEAKSESEERERAVGFAAGGKTKRV
jgi:hypothetical protein